MIALIKGRKVDTSKSEKIIQVNGKLGVRTLCRSKNGVFFFVEENGTKLVPATHDEAREFVEIHKSAIPPEKLKPIIKKYFDDDEPVKQEFGVPFGCVKVVECENSTLFYHKTGGIFFIDRPGYPLRRITKHEALTFIEDNQANISQEKLKKLLNIYFPTL